MSEPSLKDQERRPFNDGLAQKTIDIQVKEIDRLTARIAELEGELMGRKFPTAPELERAIRDLEYWSDYYRVDFSMAIIALRECAALSDPSGEKP